MTQRKPDFCPYCGTELTDRRFDERQRRFCPDCREFVYQNPVPVANVVVLDGEAALLAERGHEPDEGAWEAPGGILEIDESAAVGAARELREETDVQVDPGDLTLVRTGFYTEDPDEGSILSICFAVEREQTTGQPRVGPEPVDVQFWRPEVLFASDHWFRSVDRRRVEAAFDRLRGVEKDYTEA